MAYRMAIGFGDFGGCGCSPPFQVLSNPNGSCGCVCPDALFTLNDPVAGRSCVTTCPPGTKPSGSPYNWGPPNPFPTQSQACIADPAYVPPGSQINLQTGAVTAVGTPGTPTGAQILTPTPPPAVISAAVPPAAQGSPQPTSTGSSIILPPASAAAPTIGGFSLSDVPWWGWLGAGGLAIWAASRA